MFYDACSMICEKNMSKQNIETIRHSFSHVLMQALIRLYKDPIPAVGPAIENGFYHDFESANQIGVEDLKKIEDEMKKIIKENLKIEMSEKKIEDGIKFLKEKGYVYAAELAQDLKSEGEKKVSFYQQGEFINMCRGPHVNKTGDLKLDAFKLTKVAGAYWKGDEKNKMLQRIYGVAFETKKELDDYLKILEEAEKRDHRKLGKELDLFVFSDLVGAGMPLYTFKGATVRREIIRHVNELQSEIGYQEVHTPNINRAELFKISGHYEKFKDDMLKVISHYSEEEFFLKPMNCPQHTQIFASQMRSYKDLPIRIADFANLYRDEKPGELNGLTRLRCFCQDDGHCFCREDQIKQEFASVLSAIEKAMKTYGMEYRIRLSLWDPKHPEKYLGDAKVWEKSQAVLEKILIESKLNYFKAVGEAAMYGPKMDLMTKDSLGREWQISTIQLDFIMPQRFGLRYVDVDGKEKTPVMIHRAIVGSPERFLGILIEHYAGAFPAWLAPVQAIILPVSDKFNQYGMNILNKLKENNVRAEIDDRSETLGKKIREAEMQKIPYILVVGEKEQKEDKVNVRIFKTKKQEAVKIEKFIKDILEEIKERKPNK